MAIVLPCSEVPDTRAVAQATSRGTIRPMTDWSIQTSLWLIGVLGVAVVGLLLICWGLWGDRSKGRARLVMSHVEARHLLDELVSTGHALLREVDQAAYESWHGNARATLAHIFDNRTIVEDFELAGSGPLKLSDSDATEAGLIDDRIQGELDYLDRLMNRLQYFQRVRRALR